MSLDFETSVREAFDPVALAAGMTCASSDKGMVRYEGRQSHLLVLFDGCHSYELNVAIVKLANPQKRAELSEILAVAGVGEQGSAMVSRADVLKRVLKKLAALTSEHAQDYLAGHELAFARAEKWSNVNSDSYNLNLTLRSARLKADAAWQNKDYAGFVSAFSGLQGHLSPAEKKKLEYSRNHIKR